MCVGMLLSVCYLKSTCMEKCAWDKGQEVYTEYGEDTAGYIWTLYNTNPGSYTYDNTLEKNDSNNIRAMSFNIQRVKAEPEYSVWDQRPWFSEQRLWRATDVFTSFDPDIVCLQEIRPAMVEAFYYILPSKYRFAHRHDTTLCDTIPNAILYNTDRLCVQDVNIFPIDLEKFRLIVKVEFCDMYTNKKLYVFNIHQSPYFKTMTKELQEKGFTILNEETQNLDAPYLILGDFNVDYATIAAELPDTVSAYTGNRNSYISWDASLQSLIDGIFIEKSTLQDAVSKSEIVVFDDEVDENGNINQDARASDHRPLYADIQV